MQVLTAFIIGAACDAIVCSETEKKLVTHSGVIVLL
jgi:hypothetical protein